MKRSAPIPISVSRRWREFRIRVLPVGVFGAGVVVVLIVWQMQIPSLAPTSHSENASAHYPTTLLGWHLAAGGETNEASGAFLDANQ